MFMLNFSMRAFSAFKLFSVDEKSFIIQNTLNMLNKRKSVRYPSHARVRVPNVFEGEALLKDLSITGCCIECTIFLDIKPDSSYQIVVFPESASKINQFELTVEARWVRAGDYSCEVGFAILASPKGKAFQRYVDYLSWRSSP
jgi:hypothetical protein